MLQTQKTLDDMELLRIHCSAILAIVENPDNENKTYSQIQVDIINYHRQQMLKVCERNGIRPKDI